MSTAVATTQKRLPAWFTAAALVASVVIGVVGAQIFDSGAVGVIVFLFLYLAIVAGAGFGVEGRRYGTDRVMTSMIIGAFVAAVIPLLSLLWTVLAQGWSRMSAAGFFTSTTFGQSMADSVTGAGHAVVGTLLITGFAALISVPLGVLTAVYLVEYLSLIHI